MTQFAFCFHVVLRPLQIKWVHSLPKEFALIGAKSSLQELTPIEKSGGGVAKTKRPELLPLKVYYKI